MKIELQSPFKENYKSGYLNQNKEPRNLVLLVRSDNTKTTVSYARYLMSVKLNRFLEKEEVVDHIDNNKLNDVIENLQIITSKENAIKSVIHLNKQSINIEIECPVCGTKTFKKRKNVLHKIKKGTKPTCSRKCGGVYSKKQRFES